MAPVLMHPTMTRSQPVTQAKALPPQPHPQVQPRPPRVSSRPSLVPTASRPVEPQHGLPPLLLDLPQLAPLPGSTIPVHILTAEQYASLARACNELQLPTDELFPWLHAGADVPHSNASAYFGYHPGHAAKVPSYRGLTTIQALTPSPPPTLSSSFSSASSSSASSSSTSLSSLDFESIDAPPQSPHSLLTSSFPPTTLFTPSCPPLRPATFAIPPTYANTAVNLRTFGGQPAKYASVSDLVVYGSDGIDPALGWEGVGERLTEVLKTAIEAVEAEKDRRRKAVLKCADYKVYVVSDSFKTFEEHYPHLVAVDSAGFARNKLDFFARERDEMRVLTQSSEIGPGVFLGNTQDVPVHHPLTSDSSSSLSMLDDGNPVGYAICIEAHDQATMPDNELLRDVDDALTGLEDDQLQLCGFGAVSLDDHSPVTPRSPASSSSSSSNSDHLRIPTTSIPHLECLSSASVLPPSHVTSYVSHLVALAAFIHHQSAPGPATSFLPRRVLIHCADGYTETSGLALIYLMLSRRCSLPEAYLLLQEECGRSFFVYPADVQVLLKVEKKVASWLAREDERRGGAGMERCDSGFEEGEVDIVTEDGQVTPRKAPRERKVVLSTPIRHPWFFAETFDGHFPSRILSFLYLGNLNHASNALMLKQLGITHVVSMGESALTPPRQPPFSISSPFSSRASLPTNSLWLEERLGQISVLDIDNIADDGIAGIRRTFDQALGFIEDARQKGGKVLVHCRVGVSRSATIVIAYLMKELELDLKSAYLLTRSRRLNILIQPNLPFAATLHAFEAELLHANQPREEDDSEAELGTAGLKWSNRLAWSFFANEIAVLNERFLS